MEIEIRQFVCPMCGSKRQHHFFIKELFTDVECDQCPFLGWWNWGYLKLYDGRSKKQLDENLFFYKVEK